jgi:hypothetical protein
MSTSWTFSKKRRAFVEFLKKAGIPSGRSERLATKFGHLARPDIVGDVVGTEKGGKVYLVATRSATSGGGGGTVFVYKGSGGIEIRGSADIHAERKGRKKRAGLTRSKK